MLMLFWTFGENVKYNIRMKKSFAITFFVLNALYEFLYLIIFMVCDKVYKGAAVQSRNLFCEESPGTQGQIAG